ncbi:MAG: S6e family ribosomal protein [Nanoarchaeota archaeon]
MPFKINIGTKNGKTYKLETETKSLEGKELHQKISGKELDLNSELKALEDYEFEIAGASDKAGFTALESVPGTGLKGILLSYEKGMKKRSRREGKKKRSSYTPKGLRLRKTVRGKVISPDIVQINLKIIKEGKTSLEEIFPEQNKPKEEVKKE